MRICVLCTSKRRSEADEMLKGGATHALVSRRLGIDRQIVGRHVRNGHVRYGNPAAGKAWEKPEPQAEERWSSWATPEHERQLAAEAAGGEYDFDAVCEVEYGPSYADSYAVAASVHGVPAEDLARCSAEHEHRDGDDCPAWAILSDARFDRLSDAIHGYRLAVLG